MELIAIIIIASLLFIVIAFVYSSKSKARKRRDLLSGLLGQVSAQRKLTWDHSDINPHRAMAWSASQRLLAFAHFIEDREHLSVIDLHDIAECRLLETGHREAGSGERNITGVELDFSFKDKSRASVALPFYREEQDGIFEKIILTQKARHWKEMIAQ